MGTNKAESRYDINSTKNPIPNYFIQVITKYMTDSQGKRNEQKQTQGKIIR